MSFVKSKEQVIKDAYGAACAVVSTELSPLKNEYGTYIPPYRQYEIIEGAITRGIEVALRSLVNNYYSNSDFEQDIKLFP
jgi:hypothetical protein